MKTRFTLLLLSVITLLSAKNFSTEGNGLRQIVTAKTAGETILYISEIDGALGAYTLDGKKLWQQPTQKAAVMFEIIAEDITGNGNDELLAASSDGHIYCYSANGDMLWKYAPNEKVRFNEVAVINNGKVQIFAAGNDYMLYELDAKGKLQGTTKLEGTIRKLESGYFQSKDKQSLFAMTYIHDKFRWKFLGFIDPDTKEVLVSRPYKNVHKAWDGFMATDFDIVDIDKDGLDDVLLFGSGKAPATLIALGQDATEKWVFESGKKDQQRYAHSFGCNLLPLRDEIVMQYGGFWYALDLDGKLKEKTGKRLQGPIYNSLTFIPAMNEIVAGGEIGGGNGLYFFNVSNKNWTATEHKRIGRMKEVEDNLNTLYEQTLDFKLPTYQQKSDKSWMILGEVHDKRITKLKGADMVLVAQKAMHEDFDRSYLVKEIGEIANKKDKRGKYVNKQEDILAVARQYEEDNQPFVMWAGHGNDPFYLSIETIEKIAEVAPNTCYGFTYAEMQSIDDPRIHYFIKEYIPRLAKALRKNGKGKLYFRYKNVFWAANSHMYPWTELFFSGKYKDILVPASEDTSNRTQDVNFSGRVGMLCSGAVNDYAMRLVDDNPTSWRPLSPGGQVSASPFLRQGVMMAAYGARYAVNFPNRYLENTGYDVLYALMKSGVLPIVDKEDILSISSWHLMKDIDKHYLESIDNHHKMDVAKKEDFDAIVSVPHMQWAGVDVPEWDYSKAALGVEYRWLNFVPEMPNGMVPIAPSSNAAQLDKAGVPYTMGNLKHGWDGDKAVPAKDFGKKILAAAETGAKQMPIVVKGAAWAAVRLDETHIRLIIMDQGYIDPQEREASIVFQNKTPQSALDILSKEVISIKENKAKITIPAGSIRFIDIAY